MATRLGVDPMRDGPVIRCGPEHTCAVCSVQGWYQQWLAIGCTAGYEEFCPNAEYWQALKERTRLAASCH